MQLSVGETVSSSSKRGPRAVVRARLASPVLTTLHVNVPRSCQFRLSFRARTSLGREVVGRTTARPCAPRGPARWPSARARGRSAPRAADGKRRTTGWLVGWMGIRDVTEAGRARARRVGCVLPGYNLLAAARVC